MARIESSSPSRPIQTNVAIAVETLGQGGGLGNYLACLHSALAAQCGDTRQLRAFGMVRKCSPRLRLLGHLRTARFQTMLSVLMAATNPPISIYLTRKVGVSGVAWGTIVSSLLLNWVPMVIFVPVVLKRLDPSARSTTGAKAVPLAE